VAAEYPDTEGQPDRGGVLGEKNTSPKSKSHGKGKKHGNRAGDRSGGGRLGAQLGGGSVPSEAQAPRQADLGGGALPYTGIAAIVFMAAGILLLGSGTAMRRSLDSRYRLK
jgi:LPXTG-motif cell wall-anchored protein